MAKFSKADHVEWSSGLCDCFEDTKTCCYGFWCCPCLACTVSGRFQENSCLPLCDIFSPAIMASCGIPLCVPPAAFGLRVAVRHRYKIKGNLCKDICASCFCAWCSWCQMHRELRARDKTPVTVNVTPVVNLQPAPVMMMMMNPAPVVNQTLTLS
ncbi:hypothetical protein WMY93_032615 [Mugilogobius chulae]|uniref:Cornifelin n=1 Tax=Mugilogobius chulae TaxID=88201 RepID=A0AAW0MJ40_9GOBI